MANGLSTIVDNLPKLKLALARMTRDEVLVGVPAEKAQRNDSPINNATLAFIHDRGSPAQNIPARPFMQPGIEKAKDKIAKQFKIAAKQELEGRSAVSALNRAGQAAVNEIQGLIREGLEPPLQPGTVLNRWRSRNTTSKRKGEKQYAQMLEGGMSAADAQTSAGIKPLYNTGSLLRSITYVYRKA